MRRRSLWRRTAAPAAGALQAAVGLAAFDHLSRQVEQIETSSDQAETNLALIVSALVWLGVALLAPLTGWLVGAVVRRLPRPVGTGIGVLLGVGLIVAPAAAAAPSMRGLALVAGPLVVAGLLGATYLGVGTLVMWSSRRVLRELSTLAPMTSRALPVVMLALLFTFYNAEIWQIAIALSVGRTWAAVAVFVVLAAALVTVTTRDELTDVLAEHDRDGSEQTVPPLRRAERVNLLLVPVLVTLMQMGLFMVLVFAFLVAFGSLSIPEATAKAWTQAPLNRFDGVLGQLPVSLTLVQVAMILAGFSGLNFVASASSDRSHRQNFVDPLLDEVVHGLQVRDAYLERGGRAGAAPSPITERDAEPPGPPLAPARHHATDATDATDDTATDPHPDRLEQK